MANVLASASDPFEGREIAGGKYRIEKYRESDGLGRTYLARHLKLDRLVSARVLHGSHLSDELLVNRFNRAGLAASRVRHPNVVDVVDLGEESDGTLYLISEYIDGQSLAELVALEGPMPARRVVDVIKQIAAALQSAHRLGVIHRDLQPDIVHLLTRESDDGELADVVKVLDFGVAKMDVPLGLDRSTGHRTIEMVSGRPEYMSPEQCNGQTLDARSDLYACGCLAYFLATGQPPFSGGALLEVLMKQVKEQPAPPSKHVPRIPASLEAIILKLLAKKPERRFQSARELRDALGRLQLMWGPAEPEAAGIDIDLSLGGETVEIQNPTARAESSDEFATPPVVKVPRRQRQRQRQTVIMERPETPETNDGKGAAIRMMAYAVLLAIALGVFAGLYFGEVYVP